MKLIFILDPMCSWCWGFRPVFEQVRHALPEGLRLQYLMGGLAPDSDEPMPQKTIDYVQSQWKLVTKETGARFNWDFWQCCEPRRSTYPACRAVIAAGMQNEDARPDMIYAIQQAYYLNAKNPSDLETLVDCAGQIKLDQERFSKDLQSTPVEHQLEYELNLRRQLGVNSFPSLRLVDEGKIHNIELNYKDARKILQQIKQLSGNFAG